MPTPNKFAHMSDEELAEFQNKQEEVTADTFLLKQEWKRRDRLAQHALDLNLLAEQKRWMKFSIAATVLAALLGVILGTFLK